MAKAAAATDVDSGDAAPCQKVYYVLNIVVVLCCSPAIQQRATTIACMGIQAHEVHAHPAANNIYIALSIVSISTPRLRMRSSESHGQGS